MPTWQLIQDIADESARLQEKYGSLTDSFQASAHVRRAYVKAEAVAFDKTSLPTAMRTEWLHLAAVCLRAAATVDPQSEEAAHA